MGREMSVNNPGGGGNGNRGTSSHQREHKETAGNHSGKGDLLPHLLTLHLGGEDDGYELYGDMVGPGRDN